MNASARQPSGFGYEERRDGSVVITHHQRHAITLRAGRAAEFRAEIEDAAADQAQELMARWTGNYKHGNERQARQHPRNRGR